MHIISNTTRYDTTLSFNASFQDDPDKPGCPVFILDFIGAKNDGGDGDNWSYNTCKAPVKSSPSTNQQRDFYTLDALPIAQPTMSKH